MSEELFSLHKTDTWDLITLPPGKSVIGSCWVYKIKTRSDGSIKHCKLDWLLGGFLNSMVWIMRRLLLLLQRCLLSVLLL